MEVKPKTTEEYIVGAEKEMEFSIDTESHIIFDILRDKMYSDKIGAVAREVASNSRDANREAGREDVPVEVRIVKPNKFASIGHQSIMFEDNGLGITPDRMSDVFIKYASSTKRDSNKETGGFGLGAKTPFAYTDTFTVITVCDYADPIYETVRAEKKMPTDKYMELKEQGVDMELIGEEDGWTTVMMDVVNLVGHEPVKRKKYEYNAIIDKTNKGKMILFDSEETNEQTGTKIVVPIKTDSDRFEFENKVIKYTKYWGDNIVYKGFHNERPKINHVIEEPSFSIVKDDSHEYYGLLIDGINYPLNKSEVGIDDVGVSKAYKILLKFNTGELTISANREAVQYDKDTVELIKQKYQHVKDRIIELAQEHVDTLPSYLEACKFGFYISQANAKQRTLIKDDYLRVLAEAFNPKKDYYNETTILSAQKDQLNITFGNKEIKSHIKFDFHTVAYIKKPRWYDGKVDYTAAAKVGISENFANSPVYYADARKNKRRNETIWDGGDETFMLIFPRGGTDQERTDEINRIMTEFDMDFKMYSDVEMKKVERTYNSSTNRSTGEVGVNYRRYSRYSDSFASEVMVVDRKTKKLTKEDADGYVYFVVPFLSDQRSYKSGDITNKMEFVAKYAKKTVIVVNEAAARNWISHTGMKTLEKEYNKLWKKYKAEWEKETLKEIFYNVFRDVVGCESRRFWQFKDELEPLLPKCMQSAGLFEKERVTTKFVSQELKFDEEGLEKKMNFLFKEKYAMLFPYLESSTGWYRTDKPEKVRKHIQNYINCIS